MSPWLDVTITDPRSQRIDDPFGSIAELQESGRMWAGDLDTKDPLVSPIYGSLSALPQTWVYAGTRDVLFPDTARLQDAAQAQGLPIEFDVRAGLMHGWAGFSFLREAKEVAPAILRHLTSREPVA